MGALVEGFGAARQRHEEQLAELRRKEGLVDLELHELADLMGQDGQFLKDNAVVCEITNRTLRVSCRHSPAVTVHYNAEAQEYSITLMRNGTQETRKTTEECARAIGEALFEAVTSKSGSGESHGTA